jgi:hypothetical protein
MKEEMLMKKNVKYIAALASALLISLIGIAWEALYQSRIWLTVLGLLSLLPALLFTANTLLARKYIRKINAAKVADMQSYMLRHRAEAEKTSALFLRKLQRTRRITVIYAVFLWLLSACASLTAGMLYKIEPTLLYPCLLYASLPFYAVYIRIRKREPIRLDENTVILKKEEYPLIYAVAARAAKTLNCRGEITVILTFDCNAGIMHARNGYFLLLGAELLPILSEDELYCLCLHEFSHYSAENKASEDEMQYNDWITSDKNTPAFLSFVTNCFVYLDLRYLFDHLTYHYATSVAKETAADRDMVKHGDPEAAASVLLKLNYHTKFEWEGGVFNTIPVYAAEAPDPHYIRHQIEKFKNALPSRQADWDAMIERELLPNNASHPILRMRLETLGVEHPTCVSDESSPDYRAEREKALDLIDERLLLMQDTYEQDRKEKYIEPLARVNDWKDKGMPLSAEAYPDLVADMRQIGMNEEAEALCERAIEELDVNSSWHAYFMKGCSMLHRYDEAGAELIFRAVEANHNYLEEGLQVIGDFYCMTGKEKELNDYRERAVQLQQKEKDENSKIGFLSKDDRLSAEHLPEGMLENILSYIRSIDDGSIQNIYLVRKTISESFFTSAFIIGFDGGSNDSRYEIMHKIFRYLDTYPEKWQFSLFDLEEYPQIKFDKIEGSLVYSRANSDKSAKA